MKPATVKVFVAVFAYGGNGGIAGMSPQLGEWLCRLHATLRSDPRIEFGGGMEAGRAYAVYSDTPITMMRNRAVEDAKAAGFDFILMIDNDNEPDGYWSPCGPNSDDVKPFWETSFSFAYERLMCGLPTVIVAPYCGPPPHPIARPGWIDGGEVPYLFQWSNNESDNPHAHQKLSMLTRNEAARLSGIHPIAAAPTGVSLFALKAFEGMKQPHFYYEFDETHSHKMSTEDVTCTRDIALYWSIKLKEDVLFANCDAWALHVKTKHVGRPTFTPIETVGKDFAEAIRQDWSGNDRVRNLVRDTPRASEGTVLGKDQNQVIVTDEFIEQRMREDAEREAENGKQQRQGCDKDLKEQSQEKVDEKPDEEDSVLDIESLTAAVEQALEAEPPPKSNGLYQRDRKIGGRIIRTIGRELPEGAIEHIDGLGAWCVNERGGLPVDMAVVHSDTGQAAAALLPSIPEGSHLFCLDNLGAREHGTDKASAFSEAFRNELETGRVMADIENRNFPVPHNPQELDLVFIERYVTTDWLEIWQRHLKPNGVLAGYAGTPGEQQVVQDFAEQRGLIVQIKDGVFAMPMTVENYA